MIEAHWIAAVAVALYVGIGYLYLNEAAKHDKTRSRLEEELAEMTRKAAFAEYQMVGAWHGLFALRSYVAGGRRPSAAALTKTIDELTDKHWRNRDRARDLIAKMAAKYAEKDSR